MENISHFGAELHSYWPLIVRLIVAGFLGVLLGLERLRAHKVAGSRTYGLVSLASALFVIIGQVVNMQGASAPGFAYSPLTMAAAIVGGIGFLGAGLIIFQQHRLQNLTTAAGLWIAAAVGIATGFGLYIPAIVVTILALAIFLMHSLEMKIQEKIFKSKMHLED